VRGPEGGFWLDLAAGASLHRDTRTWIAECRFMDVAETPDFSSPGRPQVLVLLGATLGRTQ